MKVLCDAEVETVFNFVSDDLRQRDEVVGDGVGDVSIRCIKDVGEDVALKAVESFIEGGNV